MLESSGGTVTILPNNAWKVIMGVSQTLFEPASNRITTTTYEGEAVSETRTQKFVYTPQGIYAPLEDVVTRPVQRPSGACMQDVLRKRYSNYTLAISSELRSNQRRNSVHQIGGGRLNRPPLSKQKNHENDTICPFRIILFELSKGNAAYSTSAATACNTQT